MAYIIERVVGFRATNRTKTWSLVLKDDVLHLVNECGTTVERWHRFGPGFVDQIAALTGEADTAEVCRLLGAVGIVMI